MMHNLNDEMCIQDIPETNKHPLLQYHHNNDSFYMYSVPISLGKVEKKKWITRCRYRWTILVEIFNT